ncbi:hypothetical protein [Sulfurovum sp.]|uniref:hypothetical protein n=1 Tax=Sulfurovum sp. TaxID=1969726 RepID=UPI0025E23837|nr:hypothetical protein [Sulfurovum sp.]
MRHHVVILGGSYGGISALRKLQSDPNILITLIDRHPCHYLQTEGYELIAGDTYFSNTIVNLSSLCAVLKRSKTAVSDQHSPIILMNRPLHPCSLR